MSNPLPWRLQLDKTKFGYIIDANGEEFIQVHTSITCTDSIPPDVAAAIVDAGNLMWEAYKKVHDNNLIDNAPPEVQSTPDGVPF